MLGDHRRVACLVFTLYRSRISRLDCHIKERTFIWCHFLRNLALDLFFIFISQSLRAAVKNTHETIPCIIFLLFMQFWRSFFFFIFILEDTRFSQRKQAFLSKSIKCMKISFYIDFQHTSSHTPLL